LVPIDIEKSEKGVEKRILPPKLKPN